MKKLLLLFIIPFLSFGQGWEQVFGGDDYDRGVSVQQTSDGGYIIFGSTESFEMGVDLYLIKTDENGNEKWSQTFVGNGNISGQQTTDGGYIICSSINGSDDVSGQHSSLIKTDENGNEEWSQTFPTETFLFTICLSVQQTTDGGHIITGTGQPGDIPLIKTDENGEEQWYQTFGGTGYQIGVSVQQTSDGGYIISGTTAESDYGNYEDRDVYLIKTDGNGNELWNKTFGGTEDDEGYSVQQTTDGGYIITGSVATSIDTGPQIFLIKIDSEGNTEFTNTIETPTIKRKNGREEGKYYENVVMNVK